jgi:hypothetical protein
MLLCCDKAASVDLATSEFQNSGLLVLTCLNDLLVRSVPGLTTRTYEAAQERDPI